MSKSDLFESPIIRDVLPLSHPPVDVELYARELVLGVLVNDALRPAPELLDGHVVPPLLQVSLLIELPALVVEAVSYFVPDHHPDPAVVEALGKVSTVEQRLQDSRREDNIILVWTVEGIDYSGRSGPSVLVDGFTKFCEILSSLHVENDKYVLEEFVWREGNIAVFQRQLRGILQVIWIPDTLVH